MASESSTRTAAATGVRLDPWQAGAAGGVIGGVVFGILMTVQMPMIIENAIPGMYGFGPEALAIGWAIHLAHSAVLGVVFGLALGHGGLDEQLGTPVAITAAGIAYGVVLWLVLASFVMPAWVGTTTGMAPPVPDWNLDSLLGHAVYGALLGIVYAVLSR